MKNEQKSTVDRDVPVSETNGMPDRIGRYEIKEYLGSGGMAIVYLAYDPLTDREVAIKFIKEQFASDPAFRQRFRQEIKLIANLELDAIVPVYDVGEREEKLYLVMRYMPGGSLRERLNGAGPVAPSKASSILKRLVTGLEIAHKKKIVHRDIKPSNILLDNEGNPYLCDFGIARIVERTENFATSVIGTPEYMAPEQWNKGNLDARTDVYQLGVMLFEMLTGQRPFVANDLITLMDKHLDGAVPSARAIDPELPSACDSVLKRAMAKDPADRFTTPREMATALARALGEEKIDNRYQIKDELGYGRMAGVYLAFDPHSGRELALKVMQAKLREGLAFQQRFNREATTIIDLQHEAIVPVYDIGQHDEKPYVAMRLMHVTSLRARLQNESLLPLAEVFRIARRIADALDAAHSKGIIHRDIKPSNVLFDQDGVPYLSDFCTVSIAEQTETSEKELRSFPYMAPEQWTWIGEEAGTRTDIYQFGVMLFEMITGRRPFVDDDLDGLRRRHLNDSVPLVSEINPDLPPEYDKILAKAMAKVPAERFSTASELAIALTEAQEQFTLICFFNEGREYYRGDRWPEAIQAFERVIAIQPNYEDVQTYLARAKDHQRKTEILSEGKKALDEGHWQVASLYFEQIDGYKDANLYLTEARRQIQLEELYQNGLSEQQERNWIAAKEFFNAIDQLDPNCKDVDDRLRMLERKITELFKEGKAKYDTGRWQEAIDWFNQIQGNERADELRARAEKELELDELYIRGHSLYLQKKWSASKKAFDRVQQLNPYYKDVDKLLSDIDEKRRWWSQLGAERIGIILGLLGIVFALVFDFFGFGYDAIRGRIVSPTPTLTIPLIELEQCLETADAQIAVINPPYNSTPFSSSETITLPAGTAIFEIVLDGPNCSSLEPYFTYTWSASLGRFLPGMTEKAEYTTPIDSNVDALSIAVLVQESGYKKDFGFSVSISP